MRSVAVVFLIFRLYFNSLFLDEELVVAGGEIESVEDGEGRQNKHMHQTQQSLYHEFDDVINTEEISSDLQEEDDDKEDGDDKEEEGYDDDVKDTTTATSKADDQVDVKFVTNLDDISNLLRDPMSSADIKSPALQSYLEFDSKISFVLALMVSEKCSACQERINQFMHEIPQLWEEQNQHGEFLIKGLPPPVLLLLSVDDTQDAQNSLTGQLEGFGVTHVPSLLWMVRDTLGHTFVLDFVAAQAPHELTSKDILQKYQHMQTRLLWLSSSMTFEDQTGSFTLEPKYFSATSTGDANAGNGTLADSFFTWFLEHGQSVLGSVRQSFPGSLLEAEREYAKWLWYEDEKDADDGYLVLGQCRTPGDESNPLLVAFDRLAGSWVNRKDIVMVGITDCPNAEIDTGKVYIWRRHPSKRFLDEELDFSWGTAENVIALDKTLDTAADDLKNALVGATTPSILWLDRELTAPIAFPLWRKVHALLVVDIHRGAVHSDTAFPSLDQRQANALRTFRRTCREHQRNPLTEDVVCLVVPSTDIRTLTVFGVDIWTPLDLSAWRPEEEHPDPEILPVAFMTDQRFGGTRRFYCESDELEKSDGFTNFWNRFWEGKLRPFPKSSPNSRTNKAGVHIITASNFQNKVLDRSLPIEDRKHVLILFTSSMCGHCRRLVALWNQLSRLLHRIGWSSFVDLYQMDVSTDELILDDEWTQTIRWVPDLVYVSPEDRPRFVRYAEKDEYGDDVVGGIKSPMDLVDWFLRVALLKGPRLSELLQDVRRMIREQADRIEAT